MQPYLPYLIQRLELNDGIHEPGVKLSDLRFGELFALDYMDAKKLEKETNG